MAEVIGLAASGIAIGTLAAQITSSAAKLKSYYDQIESASEDLQDLIEELNIVQILIADIEHDQEQNPVSSEILDSRSTSSCLQYCKQGADRLKELTDSLSKDIETSTGLRRKWSSTKIVFRKEKIDKYKAQLQRAIRLLTLSHQVYTR